MRKALLAAMTGFVLLAAACAPKTIPAPVVTTPKFPDFQKPSIPADFENSPVAEGQQRGWTFLQSGDIRTAEHEFSAALKAAPAFFPAETALGYVELARKDPKSALPHFDKVLEQQQKDLSALLGRGQALVALNREGDALPSFEAALAVDPSQTELARRVEVMRFRGAEQRLARARDAARAGRLDEAVQAYTTAIASSPDSPFLYREVAAIERQQGNTDAALEHFRKAFALDPSDAKSPAQIGDLLEARNDFDGAAKAYSDSLAVEASADVEKKLEAVRSKAAIARLPAEYRAIDTAAQLTRADLAALIGVRLGSLLALQSSRRSEAALITDVRTNWAATWIMSVARAGVMEPYANHQFQPRTVVRRTDLAQAVARLLLDVAQKNPARAKSWTGARLKFTDLSPTHLAYPAASEAVAAGVMTAPGGVFQPSRPVTGAEAVDAVAKIEGLAGLK